MKKKVWAASVGFAILVGLVLWFFVAPPYVKSYVEKNYTGVRVGSVSLSWSHTEFHDVSIDRPGIQGHLDLVRADWDRNLDVQGGGLTVSLDELKSSEAEVRRTKPLIKGHGITLTVRRKDAQAILQDVKFDLWDVCFKSGTIAYLGHQVSVEEGCIARRTKRLKAKHVEVPIELPFPIPRIEAKQVVKFEGVEAQADPLSLTFESSSIGSVFRTSASSSVLLEQATATLSLNRLQVNHPWVSPDPVEFKQVVLEAPVSLKSGIGVLEVRIPPVTISVEPSRFYVQGEASCNDWLEAMPSPLPDALAQARGHYTGSLRFEVQRDPSPQFRVHNNCKFECTADPIARVLSAIRQNGRPLTYMAYDKNDQLFERQVGPMAKDWVQFNGLPPSVPKAFITLEDPGFLSHNGISGQALENSFKDNLKLGKFFRGGSTISMQLAKNLWLRRHKTVGRKAQEALLTTALESCLSKPEILELYMNVVEFGPNLYGIGPASRSYFEKPAEQLEPEEAFYLAVILPHPRNVVPPQQGGLSRVRGLMRVLADKGFISDELVPIQEDQVSSAGWETE